jgi:predicted helicase
MVEMKTGTHDRGTTLFPLYRYETLMGGKAEQVHNFTAEFVREWCATTHTRFIPTGHGDGEKTTGPEDVLFWLYGLFYSPEYRRRYRAVLSQRFPIVLLASNLKLLRAVARLGVELATLHLLESPKLDHPITEYLGGRTPEVEKVSWSKNTVWLDKAQTTGFRGVHEDVWNFYIGGYPVCEKWLKDRKGRKLSKHDITHYQKIVVALSETIRLVREIDEVIEQHGGWPGAFQTGEAQIDGNGERLRMVAEPSATYVTPRDMDKK